MLTIVHEPTQEEAFFGYSHPNTGLPVVTFPDQGRGLRSILKLWLAGDGSLKASIGKILDRASACENTPC